MASLPAAARPAARSAVSLRPGECPQRRSPALQLVSGCEPTRVSRRTVAPAAHAGQTGLPPVHPPSIGRGDRVGSAHLRPFTILHGSTDLRAVSLGAAMKTRCLFVGTPIAIADNVASSTKHPLRSRDGLKLSRHVSAVANRTGETLFCVLAKGPR